MGIISGKCPSFLRCGIAQMNLKTSAAVKTVSANTNRKTANGKRGTEGAGKTKKKRTVC